MGKFVRRMRGLGEVKENLKRKGRELIDAAKRGLRMEGELIMLKAKERTPVDTGALRSSGHVGPVQEKPKRLVLVLSFGGPAAPYAVYVHEDLTKHHPVGQAKFLESAMREAAPGMAGRVATSMRAEFR